jgi:hypothetical protein
MASLFLHTVFLSLVNVSVGLFCSTDFVDIDLNGFLNFHPFHLCFCSFLS